MASRVKTVTLGSFVVAASVLPFQTTVASLSAQKPIPQVKSVAAAPISSVEGADNFVAYCAVCHGHDAKGNGPAAPAMKSPVPDLTTIAKRHGRFSAADVEQIIRGTGRTPTPAHGVESMPVWGQVFVNEDRGRSTLRIGNLVKYLQSIQQGGVSQP
jgi:mono/diheme cytochrome c family protein